MITTINRIACVLAMAWILEGTSCDVCQAQDKATTTAKPWTANPSVVQAFQKRRSEFNVDESKVPEFELPDPLLGLNSGELITTAQQWTSQQRPALLQLFREHVYGVRPNAQYEIEFEERNRVSDPFGVPALGRQMRATIRKGDREHSFDFVYFAPKSDKRVPLVVHINNRNEVSLAKTSSEADPFWPVEKLLRTGYATASFYTSDVDPDKKNSYDQGIRSLSDDPESDPATRWKSLSAWGWAASRILDFALEQDPEGSVHIDPATISISGHSRGGKTALWAAAEDERFTIAYSNESGCGGAALSRRAYGETVKRITTSFPHWFCDQFASYAGRENDLPVDQHQLVALIAPRAVYVASADEDLWADPRGEYTSLIAAGPVFELFGLEHIREPSMPSLGQPRQVGATGYHVRAGTHNLLEEDWNAFLAFTKQVW